jgi:hypothetical protein
MQAKPNKKKSTRTQQNAEEKKFTVWLAGRPCCECGSEGGVIIDHLYGATFTHNKVQVGHWAKNSYCAVCDAVKTQGSHNAYQKAFGRTQAEAWNMTIAEYDPLAELVPTEVFKSIMDWNR